MSKPKDTYKGPEIYRTLNQDNKNMKLCLVFANDQKSYKYTDRKACPVHDKDLKKVYLDWDAFESDTTWQMPQLEEEHKKLFGHPIPAKTNRTDATIVIWHKWISLAEDRLSVGQAAPGSRKNSIESRIYTRTFIDGKPASAQLKTPQAMACLKIFDESMDPEKHTITEKDLKAKVIERQAELKTRQDPWRIFQYYRPQLIQAKLITHN
jgi:hypothetical protein